MLRRTVPSILSCLLALAVSALVIAAVGSDPFVALGAWAEGAFGSAEALSEVAVKTCPLLLVGLGVALAFRAGLWNIGAEGQFLVGATVLAWVGRDPGHLPAWLALPLALLAATAGGAAWAGVAAFLRARREVNEVISTIMLNFVALGLVSYLVHGPLQEAAGNYPQTDAVAAAVRMPRPVTGLRLHAGLLVGLAAAAGAHVLLFRTVLGYELRASGLNPLAARLAGLRVGRSAAAAFLLSGALAGLAGGVEVSAITFRMYERFSPGYGFTAIVVALLGRLHPAGVVLAAVLFGALEAGSNSMQRVAGVSSVLVSVVQAVMVFSLIAFERGRRGVRIWT